MQNGSTENHFEQIPIENGVNKTLKCVELALYCETNIIWKNKSKKRFDLEGNFKKIRGNLRKSGTAEDFCRDTDRPEKKLLLSQPLSFYSLASMK